MAEILKRGPAITGIALGSFHPKDVQVRIKGHGMPHREFQETLYGFNTFLVEGGETI